MSIPTIKVKPWGEGQGDHVVINEADFDPSKHERFEPVESPKKRGKKEPAADAAE